MRSTAQFTYGVNGIGVMLMLATFASTGGLTGAEVGSPAVPRPRRKCSRPSSATRPRALARRAREDLLNGPPSSTRTACRFTRAVEALGLLTIRASDCRRTRRRSPRPLGRSARHGTTC